MACQFPYMVENPNPLLHGGFQKIPVPCGKCYDCKMRTVSQWAFRLRKEDERSSTSLFVTLTYERPPMTKNGFMTLDKSDVQKWLKRLRKLHTNEKPVKYFAVGEYGGKRFRPHYHIILFNASESDVHTSWMLDSNPIGFVHVGHVSGASVAYTLKYMIKPSKIPIHKNDDRLPEFRLMSKKMGENYLTPEMKKWHRSDLTRLYTVIENGIKVALPRYYREKIWNEQERQKQNIVVIEKVQKDELENERKYRKNTGKDYREYKLRSAEYKTSKAFKGNEKRKDL